MQHIDLIQYFVHDIDNFAVLITIFTQYLITISQDHAFIFLGYLILFLQLFLQALSDLHQVVLRATCDACLLGSFTHFAIFFNKSLSSKFRFNIVNSCLLFVCLFKIQQVLIFVVHLNSLFEHQKRFGPVVLDDFLSGVVEEFELHFERFSKGFPQ